MNVADHPTRIMTGSVPRLAGKPTLGLLLGTKRGSYVSVMDSSDIDFSLEGSRVTIEESMLETKRALVTAVYPDFDILGWYTVADQLEPLHRAIHGTMSAFCDAPIFLLMKPMTVDEGVTSREPDALPITIFSTNNLVETPFNLETVAAEHISISHVVKQAPTKGVTATEAQLMRVITSLRTLRDRIESIRAYVGDVREGAAPHNQEVMRQIAKLADQLPADAGLDFADAMGSDATNTLMVANLAAMTSATIALDSLTDKFNVAYEQSRSMYA